MDRLEQLKSFLVQNPGDLFSRHALAMELIKRGDDAGARELLETVLEMNPGYIGSYYHLGKLLERNGDNASALTVYQKGMDAARLAGDMHAYGELNTAFQLAED
jgi:Tfp pilus assembly protein PilF